MRPAHGGLGGGQGRDRVSPHEAGFSQRRGGLARRWAGALGRAPLEGHRLQHPFPTAGPEPPSTVTSAWSVMASVRARSAEQRGLAAETARRFPHGHVRAVENRHHRRPAPAPRARGSRPPQECGRQTSLRQRRGGRGRSPTGRVGGGVRTRTAAGLLRNHPEDLRGGVKVCINALQGVVTELEEWRQVRLLPWIRSPGGRRRPGQPEQVREGLFGLAGLIEHPGDRDVRR